MRRKTAQTNAGAEGCKPSNSETPTAQAPAAIDPARPARPAPRPAPAPGMGDRRTRTGVGGGTLIGGSAQGRGASSRLRIGMRVRNASGRGVWGFGSIVGIVPAGVHPRWYCRHHDLPMVFGDRCAPVWRERCVVLGDDGRHHAPRHVEEV